MYKKYGKELKAVFTNITKNFGYQWTENKEEAKQIKVALSPGMITVTNDKKIIQMKANKEVINLMVTELENQTETNLDNFCFKVYGF